MIKYIVFSVFLVSLAGCAGMSFNTNLGTYVVKESQTSVRASAVEEYTQSQLQAFQSELIGSIDTEFCQQDRNKRLPSKSKLKKSLKVEVQLLGGNALVFEQCTTKNDYYECRKHVKCSGTAYLVTF